MHSKAAIIVTTIILIVTSIFLNAGETVHVKSRIIKLVRILCYAKVVKTDIEIE